MTKVINEVHLKCPFCKKALVMHINGIPLSKPYSYVCLKCSGKFQVACKVSKDIIRSVQVR